MSYQKYGISSQLVERVKTKMKNPVMKEKIKVLIDGVTKADLQNSAKVRRLVKSSAAILNEKMTSADEDKFVKFVIDQKIDPNNTLHLIKLWGMFR
ncbi:MULTISPECIES: stage VI sporulation protein F [unclassified Paenibacillus]|uniref:Stage VI sporulation protein F n=1 Tax=Paenibacillus provencensis TaxID=441151 RepID=A0ABW3PRT0_9BACL|nr:MULTISPECIES: stage VI sporulation protein F [unclassified Paenibacillus]MCM3126379.1 stage VI sporulation protein F [Paenibacillus sp. MER 78]SFS60598.1 Stage VI sporulation protein F [Paenibacillus sp. 453mf]